LRLPLLITAFLVVYGGMHFYGLQRARSAFSFGFTSTLLTGFFLSIMILAPLLMRLLERVGFEKTAEGFAYVGYTWMGFLFLFVCSALLVDAYRLLVAAGGKLGLDLSSLGIRRRVSFFIPLALAASLTTYGFFEALSIRVERITMASPKIPEEIGEITIAQVSDVHLGLIVREGRLGKILKEVEAADPDILVSTGDLIDGQPDKLLKATDMLADFRPRQGKYAVLGNHEFYAGLPHALYLTERAGFVVLRGEGVVLPSGLNMVGVDDPAGKGTHFSGMPSEGDLLASFPKENFTLLLKHRPVIDETSTGLFDLQLSGHIHGGQIFPFRWITSLVYDYGTGFFRLPEGGRLYVNRGSGTWGPPIRLLAPPEVTLITLVHGDP
jgi:uncharacterized protein